MASSSALYSEQMKSLFGFSNTGPNAPLRNIRVTRETLEKMEEDQLNATHDQLDLQEEQLKVLKKIAKEIGKGGSSGGSLIETLAGGYLGLKGLKALKSGVGGIPQFARKIPQMITGMFKTGTSQVLTWTKGITGGIVGALATSRVAIRGLRVGMAAKVRSAVSLLSSTILGSVSGLLSSIGSIIKSGIKVAGKAIAKLAGPVIAAWGAYEGWSTADKVDKGNKIGTGGRIQGSIDGTLDSLLFGLPSMIQQYRTGEDFVTAKTRRRIRGQENWEKAGGWSGTWNEFKQAIGLGGYDEQLRKEMDTSRNLATKRRNEASPLVGTMLDPVNVGGTIGATAAASAIAGTVAEKATKTAMAEANTSMFSVTSPTTKKTYSYFEILSALASTQVDLLKGIYKTANEQLDEAKDKTRNTAGLDGDFWDNMFKSYEDTSIGDQAGGSHSGSVDPRMSSGEESSAEKAIKTVGNQILPTPNITTAESLARDLSKFGANPVITNPNKLSGSSGDYKTTSSTMQSVSGTTVGGAGANDNVKSWYDFFTKSKDQGGMGYKPHQALGMIATMQGESTNKLDPGAYNPNDKGMESIGTAQWRDDRARGLKSLAKEMGKPWQDRAVQQEWYKREMNSTHKHVDSALRATSTAEEAVDVGVRKFEVPANADYQVKERTKKLANLSVGPNDKASINPRMLQSELTGDLSVKLPQYGGKIDPSGIVKQKQSTDARIRKKPITDSLQNAMAEQVLRTFGPGYTVKVYSGGQGVKGSGEDRTGSTRHDGGKAADAYVYDPEGNMVSQSEYARFAQGWLAEKRGGIGLQMRGGGIHIDEHKKRAPFWNYNSEGGIKLTAHTRDLIDRGLRGETPDYVMTKEEAQAYLAGKGGEELRNNIVKIQKQSLKEASKEYGGLANLVNGKGKNGILDALTNSKPIDLTKKTGGILDALDKSGPIGLRRDGMDIYNNGAVSTLTSGQEQLLRMQGTEIAKGMVEAERIKPKPLDFNPQVQSNAIFNAVDSAPIKNSDVAKNPTGSSNSTTDINPKDIPHTDELTMLMANSQMMG